MDIDIRNDVCKEGLLTLLSKYLTYAERNQIDLSKDNTEDEAHRIGQALCKILQ